MERLDRSLTGYVAAAPVRGPGAPLRRSHRGRPACRSRSPDGETYGLLGPNGAGKTTTISMIAGILEPDGGTVEIDGRSVTAKHRDSKRVLGFVPQEIALFDDLSASENLRFFGGLQGLRGAELRRRMRCHARTGRPRRSGR